MINTSAINDVIKMEPSNLNVSSKISLDDVILPDEYVETAYKLLRRSLAECPRGYDGHYEKIIVPLSGGLDSSTALVAAANAVGPENTLGVFLYHNNMTDGEKEDEAVANRLLSDIGSPGKHIDITKLVNAQWEFLENITNGIFPDDFEKELRYAECLPRARAQAMRQLIDIENGLPLDTTHVTELTLGNFTNGDFSGAVEVFEFLLKSEVYKFAELIGVPDYIRTQPKRISEFSSTHDKMFGADCTYLDPIVFRYLKGQDQEQITKELDHDPEWMSAIFKRIDQTKFRFYDADPISSMTEFWDEKVAPAKWVGGMDDFWSTYIGKTTFGRELQKCREQYMP